jgi:hypothetical protein
MVCGCSGPKFEWIGVVEVLGGWASVLVSVDPSAGKWMKIGWKQTDVGHGVASGFAAALVDDWFVGPDPALDGVGILF